MNRRTFGKVVAGVFASLGIGNVFASEKPKQDNKSPFVRIPCRNCWQYHENGNGGCHLPKQETIHVKFKTVSHSFLESRGHNVYWVTTKPNADGVFIRVSETLLSQ